MSVLTISILASVIAVLLVESARRPVLRIEDGVIQTNVGWGPVGQEPTVMLRYVHVRVSLEARWKWLEHWIVMQAATRALAEVKFFDRAFRFVGGKPMPGRWGNSRQPVNALGQVGEQVAVLVDPQWMSQRSSMDLYCGDVEDLNICAQAHEEATAYGWSNESYRVADFREVPWKMDPGEYYVLVEAKAVWARSAERAFLLTVSHDHRNLGIRALIDSEAAEFFHGIGRL